VQLLSVNIGQAAPLFYSRNGPDGQPQPDSIASGHRKSAVSSLSNPQLVEVKPLGLAQDEQVDLSVHGGLDKAVYVYPFEHYTFWETVSRQAKQLAANESLAFGKVGENLTTSGLSEKQIWIGDLLQIGSTILRVESPRNPCFKFNAVMGFKHASKMMMQSGFCGFYCSVVQPGKLTAGDKIAVTAGPRVLSIEQRFIMTNKTRQQDLF
jgi:MOSC domain-containing protein YiiM